MTQLPFDRREIRRIAVFRALQLGDMLVAVPALRALRAGFPEAEITLIGLPWAAWFAARFSAYVDRFVAFGGYPGIAELELDPERSARYLAEQRAERYDLAIQLHGSGRTSNPAVLALGARFSAGFVAGPPPAGLDIAVPYPDGPEILRLLALPRALGCPERGTRLELPLLPEDKAEAGTLLAPLQTRFAEHRPLVGIHAGSRPLARRWPAERFASVADHLARRHGARIVLTGGPGEEEIAARVARLMETPTIDLTGRTSLGTLAAMIARCDLFVSNDTGPAHVARAVDTPSVTVFGPAEYARWRPLDETRHRLARQAVECSPCAHGECPIDHRCLLAVGPSLVISLAQELLSLAPAEEMKEGRACAA